MNKKPQRYLIVGFGVIPEARVEGVYSNAKEAKADFVAKFGIPSLFVVMSQYSSRLKRYLRTDNSEK